MCACSYAFFYNVQDRCSYFMSDPTIDNREIRYAESMDFPAVTICNHNSFRLFCIASSCIVQFCSCTVSLQYHACRASKAAELGLYHAITALFNLKSGSKDNGTLWPLSRENHMNVSFLVSELDHQREDMIFQCVK